MRARDDYRYLMTLYGYHLISNSRIRQISAAARTVHRAGRYAGPPAKGQGGRNISRRTTIHKKFGYTSSCHTSARTAARTAFTCAFSTTIEPTSTLQAACHNPRHGSLAHTSHIGHSHVDSSRSLRHTPKSYNHKVSTLMTHQCTSSLAGASRLAQHRAQHAAF